MIVKAGIKLNEPVFVKTRFLLVIFLLLML